MKVKFANKIFEVLYTKNVAGQTMYAVEDEPNHIDWLLNVEVVNAEKKELKKIEQTPTTIADDWVEDYWQHHKVKNLESYDGGEEIQFDHDGFIRFCQTHCQKPAWSEMDEKNLQSIIDEIEADKRSAPGYDLATYDRFLYWLQSLKERCAFKPTDEQIIALRWALNNIPYCNHKEEISRLLDQIKNL